MKTGEKTAEQMINDFQNGHWYVQPKPEPLPDFHTMALLAAQTIPNKSINELLANAEKIEHWLNEPNRKRLETKVKWSEAEKDFLKDLK